MRQWPTGKRRQYGTDITNQSSGTNGQGDSVRVALHTGPIPLLPDGTIVNVTESIPTARPHFRRRITSGCRIYYRPPCNIRHDRGRSLEIALGINAVQTRE